MKKRFMKLICFFAGVALLGLGSCQNEDLELFVENKNYRNAVDFIRNNFELTLFYAALERADLLEELQGDELITVFAPANQAFRAMGISRPADFDRLDRDSLRFMLRYHLMGEVVFLSDIPEQSVDNRYVNKSGKELYLAGYRDYYYVNGAELIYPDNVLSNGVLHVIDKPLKYQEKTVQQMLADRPDCSLFTAALKQFGYWDRLATEGPWVVFAPRNEAFERHEITLADIEAMNPDDYLPRLFGSYLFNNRLFMSDLHVTFQSPNGYPRYNGNNVMVPITGDEAVSSGFYLASRSRGMLFLQTSFSGSNVPISQVALSAPPRTDHLADNGVLHEVEDLLVLPAAALREPLQD